MLILFIEDKKEEIVDIFVQLDKDEREYYGLKKYLIKQENSNQTANVESKNFEENDPKNIYERLKEIKKLKNDQKEHLKSQFKARITRKKLNQLKALFLLSASPLLDSCFDLIIEVLQIWYISLISWFSMSIFIYNGEKLQKK